MIKLDSAWVCGMSEETSRIVYDIKDGQHIKKHGKVSRLGTNCQIIHVKIVTTQSFDLSQF